VCVATVSCPTKNGDSARVVLLVYCLVAQVAVVLLVYCLDVQLAVVVLLVYRLDPGGTSFGALLCQRGSQVAMNTANRTANGRHNNENARQFWRSLALGGSCGVVGSVLHFGTRVAAFPRCGCFDGGARVSEFAWDVCVFVLCLCVRHFPGVRGES
jgi:hypothetical protein